MSVVSKYQKKVFLQNHTFRAKHDKDTEYMSCSHAYPYLNVTIRYSDTALEDWRNGRDMSPFILHEVCHPLTDPLYNKALDRFASRNEIEAERERLTDHICNIVLTLTT